MWDWDQQWSISFAGCGFRSIYYVGALSCILERVPRLVHGASRIGGASSGCLVAAALTVGIPIEQLCADVLKTAKEARRHTLGVFHPTFSLLRTVQDSLLERLPEDAHVQASGRLCVSLTRLADGKNVLVSEFESRDELVQVLMCSCFFPVYCGFIPPSYRGVRYMDGALSNNMPLFEQRNTITVAPFSGESDICPREGTFNFFETQYGNVSIQVNTGNVHRVCTSFLPPKLEKLAEICHNGYMDALRFLRERDLLEAQRPSNCLMQKMDSVQPACCDLVKEVHSPANRHRASHQQHRWQKPRVTENLPAAIKQILCRACRDGHDGIGLGSQLSLLLPVQAFSYLLAVLWLPVDLTLFLIRGICRQTLAPGFCRQTRGSGSRDPYGSSTTCGSELSEISQQPA